MVAGTGGVNGAGALLVTLPLAVQGAWPSQPVVRRAPCGAKKWHGPLRHDQWHDRIRRLMHDVHDASEAFVVHRDAGQRVRHPGPALRMEKDGVRLVTGARFADRLTRTGDRRGLRRPVGSALAFGLQGVVAPSGMPRDWPMNPFSLVRKSPR